MHFFFCISLPGFWSLLPLKALIKGDKGIAMSNNTDLSPVHVIGGGLAGSEAAWQIAQAGVPVVLHEMRPVRGTDAHKTEQLAELVCSNSFRSDDAETNAVGVLHAEMRLAGSLIMLARMPIRFPLA
ncbi:tRNA (uracil-5-)-methyltransferase, partial [Brucella abortus LMN2]